MQLERPGELCDPCAACHVSYRELHKAAIHEAAHAVIAWHLGHPATAEVFATPHPGPDDKLWTGRTQFYRRLTSNQDARLIALAGAVAELVDDDFDVEAVDVADWLESGAIALSATDAQMAGGYTMEDLEGTMMVVRHLWKEVDAKASRLARRART